MQNEIINPSPLLSEDGTLSQKGWARDLILQYSRKRIKAPRYRIKEWDYYCILTRDFGIALTVADNGYMGFFAVSWLDFVQKSETTESVITLFPMGNIKMPETSKIGNVEIKNKKLYIEFQKEPDKRILSVDFPGFDKKSGLKGQIILPMVPQMESIAMATPFRENPKAFYYNQKINCMPAEGKITYGSRLYNFKKDEAFGVLDWGRGVWPYKNTWYWGSASGKIKGKLFGFNIGYGFGDTSAASENIIFYDGIGHKLDKVAFHIDPEDYLAPWKFTSNDNRFEMDFEPILDRYGKTDLILLKSIQHQVFGYFSGNAALDSGELIYLDKFPGFAEKVYNKW